MPLKCPYLLFASFPLATVAFLGLGLAFVFCCFINTTLLYWFKKNSLLYEFSVSLGDYQVLSPISGQKGINSLNSGF